tara:strand:+ start:30 stop:194 length:165 start_codon:yes stop_codon:yes gene_type:complete
MQPLKTMKIYPETSRLLGEVSAKRKKSYHNNRSRQDIIAELVAELHKKEITGEA